MNGTGNKTPNLGLRVLMLRDLRRPPVEERYRYEAEVLNWIKPIRLALPI